MLDTSVAIKFYVNEDLFEQARALAAVVENGRAFIAAPNTIRVELWSALWRKHRREQLEKTEVRELWEEFERDVAIDLYDPGGLTYRATEISYETGAVIHDALFLVLDEALDTTVVTADEKTVLGRIAGTPYEHLTVNLRDADKYLTKEQEDSQEQDR